MTKFGFVLDDFAINSAELTDKHKKMLDKLGSDIARTIRLTKRDFWLIHLTGRASQSGPDAFNEALSARRAESVQDYLEKRLSAIVPIVPRKFRILALGESAPEDKKLLENSRDRAVGIIAILTGRLPPPPPPPPPPRRIDPSLLLKPRLAPRKEFIFTIESFVTQAVGVSLPAFTEVRIGRIIINFFIDDGAKRGEYTFFGEGIGGGLSIIPAVSPSEVRAKTRGAPQKFLTFEAITAADFAGEGHLSLLGSFHFGGKRRSSGTRRFDDFAMGVIDKLEFPSATSTFGPALPGKDDFRGEVTNGFKPRVPHWPKPFHI